MQRYSQVYRATIIWATMANWADNKNVLRSQKLLKELILFLILLTFEAYSASNKFSFYPLVSDVTDLLWLLLPRAPPKVLNIKAWIQGSVHISIKITYNSCFLLWSYRAVTLVSLYSCYSGFENPWFWHLIQQLQLLHQFYSSWTMLYSIVYTAFPFPILIWATYDKSYRLFQSKNLQSFFVH